jgi:phosphatidate cytidylyltransferase
MSFNRPVFLRRLASSITLWVVALGIIFSGNEIGYFLLISALVLLGLWEFYLMLDHKNLPNFKVTAMICASLTLIGSFYYFHKFGPAHSYDFEMAALLFFLLVVFSRQMFEKMRSVWPLETMAYTIFGLLYVVWLFNFITKIVYVTPRGDGGAITGHYYVLYLIVVTKFSDMGAYLTGSAIGRHPLVPHLSPKKTWEGFFGALAFSTLGSFGLVWVMGKKLGFIHWHDAAILGVLLGFAAIIGDLAESLIKRATEMKDSGGFLPGIGGVLDLIDSLLFTAPLLYLYMRLVLEVS